MARAMLLRDRDGDVWSSWRTGSDGTFEYALLGSGKYDVKVTAPAGFVPTHFKSMVAVDGKTHNMRFVLQRGVVLAGEIIGMTPEDTSRYMLMIDLRGRNWERKQNALVTIDIDAKGRFHTDQVPPDSNLIIRVYLKSMFDQGRRYRIPEVRARAGDTSVVVSAGLVTTRSRRGDLRLTVPPTPSRKYARVRGMIYPDDKHARHEVIARLLLKPGRVRRYSMKPGYYVLVASTHQTSMRGKYDPDPLYLRVEFQIVERQETAPPLKWRKGGSIEVLVADRLTGKPIRAEVGLEIPVEPRWAEVFLTGTDRKGRARLWGIPPGSQIVRVAHAEGYREVKQSVTLTAGKLVRVKILLDLVNN